MPKEFTHSNKLQLGRFPFLTELLLIVTVPDQSNETKKNKQLTAVLPKLGMVAIFKDWAIFIR